MTLEGHSRILRLMVRCIDFTRLQPIIAHRMQSAETVCVRSKQRTDTTVLRIVLVCAETGRAKAASPRRAARVIAGGATRS